MTLTLEDRQQHIYFSQHINHKLTLSLNQFLLSQLVSDPLLLLHLLQLLLLWLVSGFLLLLQQLLLRLVSGPLLLLQQQ